MHSLRNRKQTIGTLILGFSVLTCSIQNRHSERPVAPGARHVQIEPSTEVCSLEMPDRGARPNGVLNYDMIILFDEEAPRFWIIEQSKETDAAKLRRYLPGVRAPQVFSAKAEFLTSTNMVRVTTTQGQPYVATISIELHFDGVHRVASTASLSEQLQFPGEVRPFVSSRRVVAIAAHPRELFTELKIMEQCQDRTWLAATANRSKE
jgi:hypothetical protein